MSCEMKKLRVALAASVITFLLLVEPVSAFPSSRSHHHNHQHLDKRQHKEQHHHQQHREQQHHEQQLEKQQKQVSTQQSRSDPAAINKMQSNDPAAPAAEYPTSDVSSVSMWEYNIFLDEASEAYDYSDDDYSSDLQYEDDYGDEGPTIQNLILLAATHPRRNRNVFGLPPREVVIY